MSVGGSPRIAPIDFPLVSMDDNEKRPRLSHGWFMSVHGRLFGVSIGDRQHPHGGSPGNAHACSQMPIGVYGCSCTAH